MTLHILVVGRPDVWMLAANVIAQSIAASEVSLTGLAFVRTVT
jgi:hypothetical protein